MSAEEDTHPSYEEDSHVKRISFRHHRGISRGRSLRFSDICALGCQSWTGGHSQLHREGTGRCRQGRRLLRLRLFSNHRLERANPGSKPRCD